MVHKYDVEEVASQHHNVNGFLSILGYGGFNACVCVCVCVRVRVCVCVSLHVQMLARMYVTAHIIIIIR